MDLSVLIEFVKMLPQREFLTTLLKLFEDKKVDPGFVIIDAINSRLTVLFLNAGILKSLF